MSSRLGSRLRSVLRVGATASVTVMLFGLLAAAGVSTLGATSLSANHTVAQRDAAAVLGRVILPSDATPVSQEPAGDEGALARPPLSEAGLKIVERHRWWPIQEPVSTVYGFIRSHVPPSAKLTTWAGPPSSVPAPAASFVVDAFPPGVGYAPSGS
jgi:hypothetical protein